MFSSVISAAICGLSVQAVQVEADVSNGLPAFSIVGYASSQVKEAQERVRTALKNSGLSLPPKRITINLSPADIRKEGSGFDLPVAAAILCAMGRIDGRVLDSTMLAGEISLNGDINAIPGILPVTIKAKEMGLGCCIVPEENRREAELVHGIRIVGVQSILDLVIYCADPETYVSRNLTDTQENGSDFLGNKALVDFSEIHGQQHVKRAAEIAASGFHNFLMVGPPGSGKSMIAKRIPTIMPPLTEEEQLELTKIYSVAGLLTPKIPIITERAFRAPHHTVTTKALAGGGKNPRPGEVTLAHRSVLFLDEMPEFTRQSLEVLRQPLEDRTIQLSRVQGNYQFPASFLLVGAMNPCCCGFYPDRNRCSCSFESVQKYLKKISRPILDRIDICVEVPEITYKDLKSKSVEETSADIRKRVETVHQIQKDRYKHCDWNYNSEIPAGSVEKICQTDKEGENLIHEAYEKYRLSGRGYHRLLKLSRTIADMDESDLIYSRHIREALCYRLPDHKYWS